LHRGYSDDPVENDEIMQNTPLPPRGKNQPPPPPRPPPRKGSLSRHEDIVIENGILFILITNKPLYNICFIIIY